MSGPYSSEGHDLLELGRLAAWIGSDLGNITPFLKIESPNVTLQYCLNMQDAYNEDFLSRLRALMEDKQPINCKAISHLLLKDSIIPPDLRPFGFARKLSEMPYIRIE